MKEATKNSWIKKLGMFVLSLAVLVSMLPGVVTFAEEETPEAISSLVLVGDFDFGQLTAGYTKADAKALEKEIVVRNIGEEALEIDPSDTTLPFSGFKKNLSTEVITLEPGETASIGSIWPNHQLTPGTYYETLGVCDKEYDHEAYATVSLTVLARTTNFQITNRKGSEISDLDLHAVYKNYVTESEETVMLKNTGSGNVRFSMSSDDTLFKVAFADEAVTEETLFASGEAAAVRISVNPRKASLLEPGTHYGSIVFAAISEDGSGYAEGGLPVEIEIQDTPMWSANQVYKSVTESGSQYARGKLYVDNVEGISGDIDDYLFADLEDDEFFTIERSGYSYVYYTISPKEALPAGTYSTDVDLYFYPEGNRETHSGIHCGTCEFVLTVTPDNLYELEMDIDGESEELFLGNLTTGYTAADAQALKKTVCVTNTGLNPITLSSDGLDIDNWSEEAFDTNTATEETVAPGATYEKLWIQPTTGLEPGRYIAELSFVDDGENTESNSVYVYFNVLNEGLSFKLESSSSIFDPAVPIGNEGIDFGNVDKDSTKKKTKWVDVTNIGNVPLMISGDIAEDTNNLYKTTLTGEVITVQPGDDKSFSVTCDPSSVSEVLGVYTASLNLEIESTVESMPSVTKNVPLKIEVGDADSCSLTIDFQGKGGGEYENTTMSFPKNTPYKTALAALMNKATGWTPYSPEYPSDDDYTIIAITKLTDQELAEQGTWEAVKQAQKEVSEGNLTDNTTLYINWAKKLYSADLAIEIPACGDPIPETPAVTILDETPHYTVNKAEWISGLFDNTSFIGGRNYYLNVTLAPEFGYAFSTDAEALLNGSSMTNNTPTTSTSRAIFTGTVKADGHEYGDWFPAGENLHKARCAQCHQFIQEPHHFGEWEEVVEPTCFTPGKLSRCCTVCGYEVEAEEAPLPHRFINKTLVQTANNLDNGIYSYQCANCHVNFEEHFMYYASEGNNAVWYRDSNRSVRINFTRHSECYDDEGEEYDDVTFDFDMEQSKIRIKLDDTILSSGDYSLTTFNNIDTEVGLYPHVLNNLSEGEHTVAFIYEDGFRNAFFTVKNPKYINTVNLEIKHPVCGEHASYGLDPYGRWKAENPPVITYSENAPYTIEGSWEEPRWSNEDSTVMDGTFVGGNTAYALMYLNPAKGYVFPYKEGGEGERQIYTGKVIVNGKEVTPIRQTLLVDSVRLLIPIEAIHAIDNAAYSWAKDNSSVTASGKCACSTCGKAVAEKAATVSKVTVKPTYTTTGIRTFTAVFKNAAFKTQTKQVVIPKLKKLANPLKAAGRIRAVKASKVSKKNVTVKKAILVKKAKGSIVTFTKTKGNKNITVNKKTGAITVKKGLKAGIYPIKVKVNATETKTGYPQYKKGKKTVKVVIIIK